MSVCPFAQRRLDEAFGLAVGFGRAGLGSDVSETRVFADPRKVTRSVAEAVVGHDGLDLHAQLCVVGNRGFEEGYGAALLIVGLDLVNATRELSSMQTPVACDKTGYPSILMNKSYSIV